MMWQGALPHERRAHVAWHIDLVIGEIGHPIRMWNRCQRVRRDLVGIRMAVGQPRDLIRILPGRQRVGERTKDHLTVTPYHEVDIIRVECDIVMLGWEIAAPDDLERRKARLQLARDWDRVTQLRTGHDRDSEHV